MAPYIVTGLFAAFAIVCAVLAGAALHTLLVYRSAVLSVGSYHVALRDSEDASSFWMDVSIDISGQNCKGLVLSNIQGWLNIEAEHAALFFVEEEISLCNGVDISASVLVKIESRKHAQSLVSMLLKAQCGDGDSGVMPRVSFSADAQVPYLAWRLKQSFHYSYDFAAQIRNNATANARQTVPT